MSRHCLAGSLIPLRCSTITFMMKIVSRMVCMVGLARSKFDASLTWQLFQAVFYKSFFTFCLFWSSLSEHAIIFTLILPNCPTVPHSYFSKLLFGHLLFLTSQTLILLSATWIKLQQYLILSARCSDLKMNDKLEHWTNLNSPEKERTCLPV